MQLLDRHSRRTYALPALALLAQGLFSGLLAGCSPRYDWREVRPEGGGWSASFPARVQSASHAVRLGGFDLPMSMHGAEVGDVSFVIGVADLPDAIRDFSPAAGEASKSAATPETMKTAAKDALLLNIGGTVTRESKASILRSEKNLAPIDALALEATGPGVRSVRSRLRVRLVGRFAVVAVPGAAQRQRLVQVLVLGPQAELDGSRGREAIDTFMTSIRLD